MRDPVSSAFRMTLLDRTRAPAFGTFRSAWGSNICQPVQNSVNYFPSPSEQSTARVPCVSQPEPPCCSYTAVRVADKYYRVSLSGHRDCDSDTDCSRTELSYRHAYRLTVKRLAYTSPMTICFIASVSQNSKYRLQRPEFAVFVRLFDV